MVTNPRVLIEKITGDCLCEHLNTGISVDAIFIPFKSRPSYVSALLIELEWYIGPIYLMPSSENDVEFLHGLNNLNVHLLRVQQGAFTDFYNALLTSQHRHTSVYSSIWDLPGKRNYALLFARRMGFKRILLIDDDIRQVCKSNVLKGNYLLDKFKVTGCFVDDFPDTSILGHLERVSGQKIFPFLSGSFIFIRPFDIQGFFPCIYNEDWLFMLPHVLEQSICSFGVITQLPYDPFADIRKVAFQEFGEIIAEGLYGLIEINKYELRYSHAIWEDVLKVRREVIKALGQVLSETKFQNVLDTIFQANKCINADDCIRFVSDWETDTLSWRLYLEEMQNESFSKVEYY